MRIVCQERQSPSPARFTNTVEILHFNHSCSGVDILPSSYSISHVVLNGISSVASQRSPGSHMLPPLEIFCSRPCPRGPHTGMSQFWDVVRRLHVYMSSYSLQSIAQNTLEFLEKEEHENIYKWVMNWSCCSKLLRGVWTLVIATWQKMHL